jgi:hypothetical protein
MRGSVISYVQMCQNEGLSLQKGMNFRVRGNHSVILMSVRKNSPYKDRVESDGSVLIYEGHDAPRSEGVNPKFDDQPQFTPKGSLTENGKFSQAAQDFKEGRAAADMVRVYEKIKAGIWTDNGFFRLVDSWLEHDGNRNVFKFKLVATDIEDNQKSIIHQFAERQAQTRVIPTHIKLVVWERDRARCVTCGATDELHFDHILPFSKGGTSLRADNIQLLCARHNLSKSSKII